MRIRLLLVLFIIFSCLFSTQALSVTGSVSPWLNICENDATVGDKEWTFGANCKGQIFYSAFDKTYYAKFTSSTDLTSSIPPDAIINGISISFVGTATNPCGCLCVNVYSVKLVKNGSVAGEEKSDGSAWCQDAFPCGICVRHTYGGNNDLWGLLWEIGDLTPGKYGFVVSADPTPDIAGSDLEINGLLEPVSMTIYYTYTPQSKVTIGGAVLE